MRVKLKKLWTNLRNITISFNIDLFVHFLYISTIIAIAFAVFVDYHIPPIAILIWLMGSWINFNTLTALQKRHKLLIWEYARLSEYVTAHEMYVQKITDLLQQLDRKILRKQGIKIDVFRTKIKDEPN